MLSLLTFKDFFKVGKKKEAPKPEVKPEEVKVQPTEHKKYYTFDSTTYAPKEIWAKQSENFPDLFFIKLTTGQSWDLVYTGPRLFSTPQEAIMNEEVKVLGAIEDYRRRFEKLGLLRTQYQDVV
jgi:hypothetical protein